MRNFDNLVLFEDRHMVVINKPSGINSHYSDFNLIGVQEVAKNMRGYTTNLAHRLDRDTTGVLVLAKTELALERLREQFANKGKSQTKKVYIALLDGEFIPDNIVRATVPIAHTETDRMRIVRSEELQKDPTTRNTLSFFRPVMALTSPEGIHRTLTEVQIVTGRTHQIRVVAADFLGHPVTGDRLYNPNRSEAQRQMLHAYELILQHPITRRMMSVQAPLPDDFKQILSNHELDYFFAEKSKS